MIKLNESELNLCNLLNDCTQQLRTSDPSLDSLELRIAGGWVRDKLLGKDSDDIDIAITPLNGLPFAQALSDYMHKLDPNQKLPTIAKIEANPDQSKHLETARMKVIGYEIDFVNLRSETYASGSRIPTMTLGTPLQDALRRDITINSLFFNVHTKQVEDFTQKGLEDLSKRLIRTPLEPIQTFLDDPLRVLRCIRFATRYNFILDQAIVEAALKPQIRKGVSEHVSKERIGIEVDKMLKSQHPQEALINIDRVNLHDIIFNVPDQFEDDVDGVQLPTTYSLIASEILQIALYAPQKMGLNDVISNHVKDDKLLIRRLWLAVALIPYFNMQVKEKKRIVKAPSFIVTNSLKFGNSERIHVDNLVNGCQYLRHNIRNVDLSNRVQLATILRHQNVHKPMQGTTWSATVLFSVILECLDAFIQSNQQSFGEFRRKLYYDIC